MQKNANETAKETKNMFLQSAKELKAVTTLAACAMFAALAMILNQVASIDIGPYVLSLIHISISAATGHLTKTVMTDFSSLHPRQNRKRWNRDEMPPMWHRADISTIIHGFRTMRRAARICVISSGNRRSMR